MVWVMALWSGTMKTTAIKIKKEDTYLTASIIETLEFITAVKQMVTGMIPLNCQLSNLFICWHPIHSHLPNVKWWCGQQVRWSIFYLIRSIITIKIILMEITCSRTLLLHITTLQSCIIVITKVTVFFEVIMKVSKVRIIRRNDSITEWNSVT